MLWWHHDTHAARRRGSGAVAPTTQKPPSTSNCRHASPALRRRTRTLAPERGVRIAGGIATRAVSYWFWFICIPRVHAHPATNAARGSDRRTPRETHTGEREREREREGEKKEKHTHTRVSVQCVSCTCLRE